MTPLFALQPPDAVTTQSGQAACFGKRMTGRRADQSFNGLGLPALFGDISEPPSSPIGAHCWWWHTPHDLLENIDEANQVRDARIYVHALWRLLTDTVMPLDFAAHARDLLAELERLRAALGERFSVSDLIGAAETTRDLATDLAARAADAHAPEASADRSCVDARITRVGTDGLHHRRPLRPRSRSTDPILGQPRGDPGAGGRRKRDRRGAVSGGRCDACAKSRAARIAPGERDTGAGGALANRCTSRSTPPATRRSSLPSSLSISNWPRWRLVMCLTIANPSPVPPAARERPLSTR